MTITTLLMILALAAGPGTTQPVQTDALCPVGRVCKIASQCWVNGVWTTPCPDDAPPPHPNPSPEILMPI
jgi:hypothetical protein